MKPHLTDEWKRARYLRNCYCFERARVERKMRHSATYMIPECWNLGDPRMPETKTTSVWHKLVRYCNNQQIDPVAYIGWCLRRDMMNPAPEPNQLLTATRMEAFKEYVQTLPDEVHLAYKLQARKAKVLFSLHSSEASTETAWARALADRELSPLFSYCTARILGGERFLRIAQNREPNAFYQYRLKQAGYDEVWRGFIPRDVPDRARAFYDQLIEQQP